MAKPRPALDVFLAEVDALLLTLGVDPTVPPAEKDPSPPTPDRCPKRRPRKIS